MTLQEADSVVIETKDILHTLTQCSQQNKEAIQRLPLYLPH